MAIMALLVGLNFVVTFDITALELDDGARQRSSIWSFDDSFHTGGLCQSGKGKCQEGDGRGGQKLHSERHRDVPQVFWF